jgi:hypothetical protein
LLGLNRRRSHPPTVLLHQAATDDERTCEWTYLYDLRSAPATIPIMERQTSSAAITSTIFNTQASPPSRLPFRRQLGRAGGSIMPVQYSHINGWLSPSVALPPALAPCLNAPLVMTRHWVTGLHGWFGTETSTPTKSAAAHCIDRLTRRRWTGSLSQYSEGGAFFSASRRRCQASIMLDLDRDLPFGPRFIDEPAADQSGSSPRPSQ